MTKQHCGRFRIVAIACLALSFCIETSQLHAEPIDFEKQIAPILVSHCLECHRGDEPEGGLRLTESSFVRQGGDSGAAVVVGSAEASLIWQRVRDDEMPPKHPLGEDEKAVLRKWLDEGAKWASGPLDLYTISTETRAGRDWWSLQQIQTVAPPEPNSEWGRNAIDEFILKRLQENGLKPSPESDARHLIRRLYFDLIGLPPSPEQVSDFVRDPSDASYQNLVTELLDSPHYGERWGRHWLDVVRFGESDGFERNVQRENAWHYRDWIIDALNQDMPYDEFVHMQLIGDQISDGIDGAAATGFWVAGVHNTVVGGSERMKRLARQDEIEDVLATVGQTFTGLTFNCARCHDHKFDPITQTEYYQLASAISGLGYGERSVSIPDAQLEIRKLEPELAELRTELVAINETARQQILDADKAPVATESPKPFARWEFDNDLRDSIGGLHGVARGSVRLEAGTLVLDGETFVETKVVPQGIVEKTLEAWIQLDNFEQRGGAAVSIGMEKEGRFDAIVFGEREPLQWMTGSNNFLRTDSFDGENESDAVHRPVHLAIVYQKDGTIIGYRDGVVYGHSIRKADLQPFAANETQILFGLRHKPPGGNRHLTGRIHRAAFYDRALTSDEVAASASNTPGFVTEEQLTEALDTATRKRRADLRVRLAKLEVSHDELAAKSEQKVYTLTAGVGETTQVLLRGDPAYVGKVVSPAATGAIVGLSAEFNLPPDAPDPQRRRKLAEWITNPNNPLFARVIANRVWHYHFGAGIVETPNDFGFNGGRPTHPQLLDYLADEFRKNGFRLKWLHRMMVTSSSYRQSAYGQSTEEWQHASSLDSSNRWLWRANIRRVDAESLRDAMLSVAGQLNRTAGGPSFKDVSITLNSGTTYYEPIDVDGPEFFRRTVYRFNPRGGRSALLDTFDCPDPASTAPRRSVSTTPLQSLSLLNNALVLRMSNYFADRVRAEAGEEQTRQIHRAWQLAISRSPTETEFHLSEQLVTEHGLSALCRGLFNVNEFVVLE